MHQGVIYCRLQIKWPLFNRMCLPMFSVPPPFPMSAVCLQCCCTVGHILQATWGDDKPSPAALLITYKTAFFIYFLLFFSLIVFFCKAPSDPTMGPLCLCFDRQINNNFCQKTPCQYHYVACTFSASLWRFTGTRSLWSRNVSKRGWTGCLNQSRYTKHRDNAKLQFDRKKRHFVH